MVQRFTPIAACAAFILALVLVVPAYGQVEVEDHGVDRKPLEPWGVSSQLQQPTKNQTSAKQFGDIADAVVVSEFKVTDVDAQNDDPSDVKVNCITVDNLGTATGGSSGDILTVAILDQNGNLVASRTPSSGRTTNIQFTAKFGRSSSACRDVEKSSWVGEFRKSVVGGSNDPYTIPDGQSEVFQLAVLVNDSGVLRDESQNHTVQLRTRLRYSETVGSFPASTDFSATVTDSHPEEVYNGGINDWSEDTFTVEPLMPGETGTVSRFTVCDKDSNEYNLILDELWFRQGPNGTALHSDIDTLKVYRLDGNTRTPVSTLSVDKQSFDRKNQGDGVSTGNLNIYVGDDSCSTFEVDAELSQYAFKGKMVQLEVKLSAAEPRNGNGGITSAEVHPSADPKITTSKPTVIGKGLVGLGNVNLIASTASASTSSASAQNVTAQQSNNAPTGQIPVFVQGMKLPGLGAMQATFKYDPSVIEVKGIKGAPGYTANSNPADNRRGEFTFQVMASDMTKSNFDPSDERVKGVVAYINVKAVGNAGDRTRLLLNLQDLKLANDGSEEAADDVGVQPGEARLVPHGDVNGDMKVTINDSTMLANELVRKCVGLDDFQQIVADVASNRTNDVPKDGFDGCSRTLGSGDVAKIASLALNATSSAGVATSPVAPLAVSNIQTSMDGRTLEFAVQGSGVQSMQVDMFSLGGHRVISEATSGNRLTLRAQAENGQPLANGVYLYKVTVNGYNDQVHRSEVRKLIILR